MKRKHILIGAGVTALAALALAPAPTHHVGPSYLYPNSKYTVGVAATLNTNDLTQTYNGKTYSQSHRNVTSAEKMQVYSEYSTTTTISQATFEVDHFYPMCAGGSNDIKNLWLQPAHNFWDGEDYGFHAKDKLESWVCDQIKAGALDPHVAFNKITGDWVSYYKEVFESGNVGAVVPEYSEDDTEDAGVPIVPCHDSKCP